MLQCFKGELCHISQKEKIDESCKTNVVAVKNQAEQKKDYIHYHIEGSEFDWNEGIKSSHEGLEGIHSKEGMLEEAYSDSTDKNTDGAHETSFDKVVFVENIHLNSPAKKFDELKLSPILLP